MDIIYWTWSKRGEHLEKSYKSQREIIEVKPEVNNNTTIQSLEVQMASHSIFKEENKREINSDRLSKRTLVTNRQINPYLIGNNYVDDISVQDNFLRPKNSNFNVTNKDLNDN